MDKRILAFGGGTQSTALLIASINGDILPYDLIIFSDTHAEPKYIYDWIEKCQAYSNNKIVINRDKNLEEDILTKPNVTVPFKVKNIDNTKGGMLHRRCTRDYKIDLVVKSIRDFLGIKPRQKAMHALKGTKVELHLGISMDEAQRAKDSRKPWLIHKFPLLTESFGGTEELPMDRTQCEEYVLKHMGELPPKSACYFCPYRTTREWIKMKNTHPEEFERAVNFERKLMKKDKGSIKGELFIHKSLVPLDQAVEQSLKKLEEKENEESFLDECDGICQT